MEKEETGVQEIVIDKEGDFQLYSKKKWKPKWLVLSGGALFYKSKKKEPELDGPILLKDATISVNDEHKKKFAFQVITGGTTYVFSFEDEEKRNEWLAAVQENKGKEVGGSSSGGGAGKKKQSTAMRIKKNVGGSVATSGAGKGLIKEFLGKDGVKLLDIVKKIVTLHEGKKKSRRS